ncbi:MAG: hypothetical protein J0H34_04420 [Rhizobiales bacterium]|nr:hypothetical protein [Hyphomicrobiales bacterium]
MAYRIEPVRQSARRRTGMLAGFAALILAASGCSNIYEGVGPASTVPSISGGSAEDTGTYPNLNIRPKVAGQQFTAEQEAASRSQLASSASLAKSGVATTTVTAQEAARLNELKKKKGDADTTITAEETARLKKLAADKGESVRKEIEAGE